MTDKDAATERTTGLNDVGADAKFHCEHVEHHDRQIIDNDTNIDMKPKIMQSLS